MLKVGTSPIEVQETLCATHGCQVEGADIEVTLDNMGFEAVKHAPFEQPLEQAYMTFVK